MRSYVRLLGPCSLTTSEIIAAADGSKTLPKKIMPRSRITCVCIIEVSSRSLDQIKCSNGRVRRLPWPFLESGKIRQVMVNKIIKQLRINTVDYGKLRKNAVKYGNNGELR